MKGLECLKEKPCCPVHPCAPLREGGKKKGFKLQV